MSFVFEILGEQGAVDIWQTTLMMQTVSRS